MKVKSNVPVAWLRAAPALEIATDSESVATLVRDALLTEGEIDSIAPHYLRYKGSDGGLVGWNVAIATPRGVERTFVSVRVASRSRLASEAERFVDRRYSTWAGLRSWRLLESEGLLLLSFPADRSLPQLRHLVRLKRFRQLLAERLPSAIPEGASIDKRSSHVALVRFKPERRAVLRWSLTVKNGERRTSVPLWLRIWATSAGGRTAEAQRALLQTGFDCPRPLIDAGDVLVETEVSGHVASSREIASPLGAALARLHATRPPKGLPSRALTDEIDRAYRLAGELREIDTDLASRVDQLGDMLAETVPDASRTVLLHGDLHAGQALRTSRGVALVDFDRVATGSPAIDFASFLAHATLDGASNPDALREALLETYADERTPPPASEVDWFEASATLGVALAPLRRLDINWFERLERLVGRAEALLSRRSRAR